MLTLACLEAAALPLLASLFESKRAEQAVDLLAALMGTILSPLDAVINSPADSVRAERLAHGSLRVLSQANLS